MVSDSRGESESVVGLVHRQADIVVMPLGALVCAKPTAKYPAGRTGTSAGYQAHRKIAETACVPCRAANSRRSATKRDPEYLREWVASNRDRLRDYNRERRDRRLTFLNQAKSVPCADCGNRFPPVCMDFDHVRGEKKFSLSRAMTRSMEEVLSEIAKCEVVCANCHRIRTAERASHTRTVERMAQTVVRLRARKEAS